MNKRNLFFESTSDTKGSLGLARNDRVGAVLTTLSFDSMEKSLGSLSFFFDAAHGLVT